MATTIVRGVVVSSRATISDCICCYHRPSAADSPLIYCRPLEDETIDFWGCSSSSSHSAAASSQSVSCGCVVCVKKAGFQFGRIASFTPANISTSTVLVGEAPALVSDSSPVEHTASYAALGRLRPKESPLFVRKSQSRPASTPPTPSTRFSLRTLEPVYARSLNSAEDIGNNNYKKAHGNTDHTAIEAISMSTSGTRKATSYTNSPGVDINRNNGYIGGNGTIMTSGSTEKREHLYKILVIGELGTGKTSFIKRYVHQFFSQNYRATIGVDFALKVLHWDSNTIVRLQLWDIAGQERFGNMTRVYYKEAVGAFIVFDVCRSGTFDCVSKWKEDLDSKVQLPDGSPIPCILLANKCDQEKQGIVATPEKMDEYVRENGFAGWFETSAKENINIDEAARALVNKILLNDKLISAADLADSEKLNLNNSAEQSAMEGKSKCSC